MAAPKPRMPKGPLTTITVTLADPSASYSAGVVACGGYEGIDGAVAVFNEDGRFVGAVKPEPDENPRRVAARLLEARAPDISREIPPGMNGFDPFGPPRR